VACSALTLSRRSGRSRQCALRPASISS
jgi:hypothetical protein